MGKIKRVFTTELALVPGNWQHQYLVANGIRFHFASNQAFSESSPKAVFLFVHSFGELWWSWSKILENLAAVEIPALAIDLRGFGASDKPPRGYDPWTLSADINALINILNLEKVILVTHSFSSILGWTLCTVQPRKIVGNLTINGPHPVILKKSLLHNFKQAANILRFVLPLQIPLYPEHKILKNRTAYLEKYFRTNAGNNWLQSPDFVSTVNYLRDTQQIPQVVYSELEFYRWLFRSSFRRDGKRFIQKFLKTSTSIPTVSLVGSEEKIFSPQILLEGKTYAENFQTLVLPNTGHFPHLENPQMLTEKLLSLAI